MQKTYGKSIDEYFKDLEERNYQLSQMKDEEEEEFNIFTSDELTEMQKKLFEHQYDEFIRIKNLLEQTEALKKKKQVKLDSLPSEIYKKYEEVSYNFCLNNNIYYETQEEIQEYLENKRSIKEKLVQEALNETEVLCRRYLDSRQDKSILYPVRLETDDFLNPRKVEDNPDEENVHLSKK